MGVLESGPDATPETINGYVTALVTALDDRGLVAEPIGTRMVRAKNIAADAPGDDARTAAMSPGLRQTVLCERGDSGEFAWFWMWAGPTREAPPEAEYLGPAADTDEAADRIARVLRLDGSNAEPAP